MQLGILQTAAAPHFVSEMGDRRSLRASDWEETVFEASQGLLSGSLSALKALVCSPQEVGSLSSNLSGEVV